jgi:hypothetical protein
MLSVPGMRSPKRDGGLPYAGSRRDIRSIGRGFLQLVAGQSLVETALMMPFLLVLLFNAVNFAYFFLIAINIAEAPRSGVTYSTQGFASPTGTPLPAAGPVGTVTSVSYLTYQDMTGAIYSPAGTPVQVCSQAIGLNNTGTTTQTAKCATYGSAYTFPSPDIDPESPNFVLQRVDVAYAFTPLINGTWLNIFVLATPVCTVVGGSVTCTFHRKAEMRAIN